jgi:hypothetical protein
MRKYIDPGAICIAAFVFDRRPKDYGGVHLSIRKAAIKALEELLDEIAAAPKGYSRAITLPPVDESVPNRVFRAKSYQTLAGLRIGSSPIDRSHIETRNKNGVITLSPTGMEEFRQALKILRTGRDDFCIVGDSQDWNDRLWFWIAD